MATLWCDLLAAFLQKEARRSHQTSVLCLEKSRENATAKISRDRLTAFSTKAEAFKPLQAIITITYVNFNSSTRVFFVRKAVTTELTRFRA